LDAAGVLVARHRRPPIVGPPVGLVEFRPDDWISHSSPYWAWLMARFEWTRDHPDDFRLGGDVLDRLHERAAYRRGLYPRI
jgi:hypothetical protein